MCFRPIVQSLCRHCKTSWTCSSLCEIPVLPQGPPLGSQSAQLLLDWGMPGLLCNPRCLLQHVAVSLQKARAKRIGISAVLAVRQQGHLPGTGSHAGPSPLMTGASPKPAHQRSCRSRLHVSWVDKILTGLLAQASEKCDECHHFRPEMPLIAIRQADTICRCFTHVAVGLQ